MKRPPLPKANDIDNLNKENDKIKNIVPLPTAPQDLHGEVPAGNYLTAKNPTPTVNVPVIKEKEVPDGNNT